MKSERLFLPLMLLVALTVLTMPVKGAESGSIYGHVSFVEKGAAVMRADGTEDKAVVNLPLVPGDSIVTGRDGRCELQFDNGTVIRLDKESRLRITTVQAPTLTSRWNVTTLDLLQGQLYALPQTYGMELFQIITANAAVKLENRTAATIRFEAGLGTTLFSDGGRFEALYGADGGAQKKVRVKSGQSFIIHADHALTPNNEKRNLEFVAWNEYVDRHFKELHFGISKVPPKMKFANRALTYWAEKWSSFYGEWIYDELFGYVWKPASEMFAHEARPFFFAERVRINGELFLVPQEAWGWVPAHMGTWVWLKRGWTWIPGDWFHSGVIGFFARNGIYYPGFYHYFWSIYGGFDLYQIFREYGIDAWRDNYYGRFHRYFHKPPLKDTPREVREIFKRINKAPLSVVSEQLQAGRALQELEAKRALQPVVPAKADPSDNALIGVPPASSAEPRSKSPTPDAIGAVGGKIKSSESELKKLERRDWNPDSHWAVQRGYTITYSSSRNAVLCPELKISSDRDSVIRRGGANGQAWLGEGVGPFGSPQPVVSGSSGEANAAQAKAQDAQSGKKDDSGK
jgi:hypothetical protein